MSRLKTPLQKKLASLALDRRNEYGENDKSSRKAIPRGKQRGRQSLRRAAKRPLRDAARFVDDESAGEAQFDVTSAMIQAKRRAFRKHADTALGAMLKYRNVPYVPTWEGGDPFWKIRDIYQPRARKLDRS